MPTGNPNARNRARRRDPLRRAVRAPLVKPTPVPCPIGKCEHLAGVHDLVKTGTDGHGWPVAGASCTVCECEGALE